MATFQYLDEGNTEAQVRLATSFLLEQSSAGLATTGVLSGLAVTQTATASDSVLVAVGAAPIQASVGTGVALMVNDTSATLEVLTSNPVGALPRHDIVVMDSVTKAISVIVGDPNAAPTDPTVPATACALARLRQIADGQPGHGTIPTSIIDNLRVRTSLRGAGATVHPDPATGATLGANVTGGITAGVTIAAAPYDRVIRGGFGAQPSMGDGELQIYRDGAPIRRASGLAVNAPRSGSYVFTLAAGDATSLGLVVAAGASGCTVSNNGTYVYHNVVSEASR